MSRKYNNRYPSVTTILGVLRKIGLEWWFKVNTPEYIEEKSSLGKKIGTEIHEAIHQYITTGRTDFETEHPEEVSTALKSFVLFKEENPEVVFKLSEQSLTSENHQFNGTIDCIGDKLILDWKTGEAKDKDKPSIYDEYKYQVSAYVNLWNETHKEQINTAYIVAVAKDKVAYNLYKMDTMEIGDCFHEVFLPCLKIYNYQRKK